jgi:MOSC domain-containing protein YiiM
MPSVTAVHRNPNHEFSKQRQERITLVEGYGVAGDAHMGVTVQHVSRVKQDPTQQNLRQVHLIHGELLDDLNGAGFPVAPGDLGENLTTRGLDLMHLPTGTRLRIGHVVLEVTGLRNPCYQLDDLHPGLMKAVTGQDAAGNIAPLVGVMAIVRTGGDVTGGDPILVELPPEPHRPLKNV